MSARNFAFVIAIVAGLSIPGFARAGPFDVQQQAIELIANAADRICSVVSTKGEAKSSEAKGNVTAQLSGLASKLADVGVSGSGSINSEDYQSVLRQDLAATLRDNAACKLKVFETLQSKLLGPAPAPAPLPAPAPAQAPAPVRVFRVLDTVPQGFLNMRTGAGTNNPVVVAIPAGASDLIVGHCRPAEDNTGPPWCEVQWHENAGWVSRCCMVEVTNSAPRTFRVLTDASQGILNIRSGPGVNHDLIASIPAGASDVTVVRCSMPDDGGHIAWCQVKWRGQTRWASACCMVDVKTGAYAGAGQ